MGEFAIVSAAVAKELVDAGFKLREVKEGKAVTVYYFDDTQALSKFLENLKIFEKKY